MCIIIEKNLEEYTAAEKKIDVPMDHNEIEIEKIRDKSKRQQKSKSDTDTEESSLKVKEEEIKIDLEELNDNSSDSKQSRKKVHIRRTDEELDIVRKRFKRELFKKINPGKAKCTTVLREEPILHRRTWMLLNTCVNNMYVKGIKKSRRITKRKKFKVWLMFNLLLQSYCCDIVNR